MNSKEETISYRNTPIEKKRMIIKGMIEEANSQFITVDFIKLDGSERSMNIQNAALKNHLVEEYKSESTRQAVETRKANNPHLMSVYDVQKHAIRSINLDTVYKITANKVTITFDEMPTK